MRAGRILVLAAALVGASGAVVQAAAQAVAGKALVEQAAAAMGGLERLRGIDNFVLTGFGAYLNQQGGSALSPDPHAPLKMQFATDAERTFDLRGWRAASRDRRASTFPYAIDRPPERTARLETGAAMLDHPLPAVLAALDPKTRLGTVHTEDGVDVVEFTIEQGTTLWLAIDPVTKLPAWVRSIGPSTTLGDVTTTTYFTGYLPFDDVLLPVGITAKMDWRDLTAMQFDVDSYHLNVKNLEPFPAPRAPSTQQRKAVATKLADHVWDVRIDASEDGGAVVEFADHLTMFEAYNNEADTFARIDLANTLVPGKQVTQLIVTHHHFDHSGGLRAAVARGLTVISRRGNEGIFREMVARPAVNFPDALARNPKPLKFVPVDEHLVLEDSLMRLDVYHVVGHLHMAEAVFAYAPAPRILMEGDFTTYNWDWNWWGGAYMDNVDRYHLDPAINVPVHGKVTPFKETIATIEKQVQNARAYCTKQFKAGIYPPGCPVQYSRDRRQ